MRILIVSQTRQKALEKFKSIVEKLDAKEIKRVAISSSEAFAELYDDTYYKVVSTAESFRGIKVDKVFADTNIPKLIYDNFIVPSLVFSILPENDRIEFYS